MAYLSVRWAASGEVLADFGERAFQALVDRHGNTAGALKLELISRGFGESRFRMRLLCGADVEMEDGDVLLPPLDLKLVRLALCPPDLQRDQRFVWACGQGWLKEVDTCLRRAQDPDAVDEAGQSGLHEAIGHIEVMRLLLEARACPDQAAQDEFRSTPLHYATLFGAEEMKLLLEARASPDKTTAYGSTPLHQAAEDDRIEATRLLLEARALCDQTDHDGFTPLHLAARDGYAELMGLLLEARASCDPVAREAVRVLLEAGADRDRVTTDDCSTPVQYARWRGDWTSVSLLESTGIKRMKRHHAR